MIKVKDVYDYLSNLYKIENSSNFDLGKVGLQFGSYNDNVRKAIVCLDITNEVIDEAISLDANLVIAHHPFMFSPLLNLNYDSPFGKKILKIINNRINIMAYHTCFDVAVDGMNEVLAKKLNLKNITYTNCELNSESFIRLGECQPTRLSDFCQVVKNAFNLKGVNVAGDLNKIINRVAIVGGSGSSEFYNALKSGADVFISGQLPHHLAIEAIENNFSLIEVSHSIEFIGIQTIKDALETKFNNEFDVIITKMNQEPFKLI